MQQSKFQATIRYRLLQFYRSAMTSLWLGQAAAMLPHAQPYHQTEDEATKRKRLSHSLDKYHEERSGELSFRFENDLYTNAFIACLESKVKPMPRACCDACVPFVLMLGVAVVQAMTAIGANQYVEHELLGSNTRGIALGASIFLGTGQYLPIEVASQHCGRYEQLEMTGTNTTKHDIVMADGTVYAPSDDENDLPMFYSLKLPSLTWNPRFWSTDRSLLDDAIFASYGGFGRKPPNGNGFSALFITLTALWFCTVMYEFRNIFHLAGAINSHVWSDSTATHYLEENSESQKFQIVGRLRGAPLIVGIIIVLSRMYIAALLLYVGSRLAIYTTNKLDLVLNGLALTFILELDTLVFFAVVTPSRQQFIADIEDVIYRPWFSLITKNMQHAWQVVSPVLKLGCAVAFGIFLRYLQLDFFEEYSHQVAALCLFAGPPPVSDVSLVAPVQGFCESLLGVTCAPTIRKCDNCSDEIHGPCVITNQTVLRRGSVAHYLNSELYEGMFVNGTRQSWIDWGPQRDTLLWEVPTGTIQDDLRRACLQMYDPSGTLDSREVDPDTGEIMNGSPFYCASETIPRQLFADPKTGLMGKGFKDPAVIKALDKCAEDNMRRVQEKREAMSKITFASVHTRTGVCKPSCSKGTATWSVMCKHEDCVHCAACQPPNLANQQPVSLNLTELIVRSASTDKDQTLTLATTDRPRHMTKLRQRMDRWRPASLHTASGGELRHALHLAQTESR